MTPEHVITARDSVLGSLTHYYTPQAVHIVQAQGVQARDFGAPENRAHVIYRAVLAIHAEGLTIDPLTLEGFLCRHRMLERAGGRAYLELLAVSASPGSLKEHACLVAESGRWDRLLRLAPAFERVALARDDEELRVVCAAIMRDVLPEEPVVLRVVA